MANAEVAAKVCEAIALGSSLRSACKENWIDHSTFLTWTREDEELANQYARAREMGWALLADEIVSISDEADYEPVPGPDGEARDVRFDSAAVARNRLRVDSRKWMLSKMLPKIYGDKIEHAVGGLDGGPLKIEAIAREIIDPQ